MFEPYTVLDGHLAIALDGTGTFSSHTVHCDHCCVKNHQDGSKTSSHQALVGAVVHPELKEVFPLAPEPLHRNDGTPNPSLTKFSKNSSNFIVFAIYRNIFSFNFNKL